jgi:hypothetical protein
MNVIVTPAEMHVSGIRKMKNDAIKRMEKYGWQNTSPS